MKNSYKQAGLSLVELMVALVAGLIVVGAVLTFTMSSLRANTHFIESTRLTQELRTNLSLITDELRRAGYDEASMQYVARPATYTQVSPFSTMLLNTNPDGDTATQDSCVVFAYDRLPGTAGALELSNGEIRAFRWMSRTVQGRQVGVLEFAESSTSAPACDGGSPNYSTYPATCGSSGWCAISDPRVLDVTAFNLNPVGVVNYPGVMQMRRMRVELRGRLLSDPNTVKGAMSNVRIRADCVRTDPATNCTAAPVGV